MDRCLVCFSGGFDSTSCLFYALRHFDRVGTIGFDYGQTNRVELECRQNVLQGIRQRYPVLAEKLDADCVVDISSFGKIAHSSLTANGEVLAENVKSLAPNYVPVRNVMFMACAGARAFCIGAHTIIAGTCQADFDGYPDCRRDTLDAMQKTLSLASDYEIRIVTPLMFLSKAQTWEKLLEMGGEDLVGFVARTTHSCDLSGRTEWHEWGFGCGECESCRVRRQGYEEFRARVK